MSTTNTATSPDYSSQRASMVDGQLRPHKVNDRVLQARFAAVPREVFVEESARPLAYLDEPVSIGQGRTMLSSMVCARLIQALHVQPDDSVLVLAGGTGFSTAILAGLVQKVTLVEQDDTLRGLSLVALKDYFNVDIQSGSPAVPRMEGQSFNAILIDAPVGEVPAAVTNLLTEGGRLACIRQGADGLLEAAIMTRQGKTLFDETLFETKGDVLPAFAKQERFVF